MGNDEYTFDGPVMLVLKDGRAFETSALTVTDKGVKFPLEKIIKTSKDREDLLCVVELDGVDINISERKEEDE